LLDAMPLEEAQAAAIMAAADLRIERRGARYIDAQQLVGVLAVEVDVEHPAGGHFLTCPARLACQPEHLGNGIAERPEQCQPARKRLRARLGWLVEPKEVVRQVELAGPAGDGAAVLDRR